MSSKAEAQKANYVLAPSRWFLTLEVCILRAVINYRYWHGNRTPPAVTPPSSTLWIDSTLSSNRGRNKIKLDIWAPTTAQETARPCVIVFHAGGWIFGRGTDDSRWAMAVMAQLNALVIAVTYRLAPEYPFPTPVEDCADAILHISSHAPEYSIDREKIVLSGFSAGGNMVFSAHHLLSTPSTWGYPIHQQVRIKGIISFYPGLDWSISRQAKRDTVQLAPEYAVPNWLSNIFDKSYLHPMPNLSDPRLSPAIAPDEDILKLPPVHMCLCEYDLLLAEGLRFRDRLERLGKEVNCRVVKGEKHLWDKPPPRILKDSVAVEYGAAIEAIRGWLGDGRGRDS